MKVINTFLLDEYKDRQPETKGSIYAWLHDVRMRDWTSQHDVLLNFPRAEIYKGGEEIRFEIQKDYCYLLAGLHYPMKLILIKTIGSLPSLSLPRIQTPQSWSYIYGNKAN